jgi:hypothetical protein
VFQIQVTFNTAATALEARLSADRKTTPLLISITSSLSALLAIPQQYKDFLLDLS